MRVDVRVVKKDPLEIPVEDIPRIRLGEVCDNCGKRKQTKKLGKKFLCQDCRKPMRRKGGRRK